MNDLINYEFCRAQHGFGSDAEVRDWFCRTPLNDFRTFSENFSPIDYLLDHEDILKAGVHPIEHYLNEGHKEGRKIKRVKVLRSYEHSRAATRVMPPEDARVAIVLHIFYPSYVPYFISKLGLLEGLNWDLFISAPAEVVHAHGDLLRSTFGDRLRALRTVPNRGRNFGPLLVDFAAELSTYDAICHCHSKLSLHSGREQAAWADYLISSLIGAPDVVQRHLNLILSGGSEVISPAPFIGVPSWASHMLSNEQQFGNLCERLGLDGHTGFMAYPVGGMLWMSKSVFATIASLTLTYDNFPSEPSRADGELHHALERLIGRIADRRLAFYDQITGEYWAPDAVLREEFRRSSKLCDMIEAINTNDTVTFDFFDTLCVRSTGDEEWAKRRVEFIVGQDYKAHRNSVEARLRSNLAVGQDVPLSLIAQALDEGGFEDAIDAVALERAFDLATLIPRPQIVQAYEYAIESEKSVLIISDSYYDQGFIRSFLLEYGLGEPDEIITSADIGLRKDRGDLWQHLLHKYGSQKSVHIGDNVQSDVQKASEHGFSILYVPHWRQELLPFSGFSKKLLKRNVTNPGFARSTDRPALEIEDDALQERYVVFEYQRGPK